ncbi:MAG: tetratricopeptide repeat protein [Thermodesulfobacteriota bacterium]|jgi:Flp pilus assembly protein TadD
MSLIRDALKKAADETESPSPLPPDKRVGRKRFWSSKPPQILLVVLLLICLAGVLVYSFFPTLLPFLKNQPLHAPKPIAKKIEIKTPVTPLADKNEIKAPVISPDQGKVALQTKGPEKVETKSFQPLPTQRKESPEKEQTKKSADLLKTVSPRFISPRSTARIFPRPSLSKKMVTKTRPPSEIPEPPKAKAAQGESDSLQVVRLFNESVRNQQKQLYSEAIQGYQEILFMRPNHWETYNNLGMIYQDQKRFTQALEMFQKALSLNPRYQKGFNNLGLFYLNQGKLEEAGNQFRKVMELDPNFLPAYINLAVVLNRQGQVEQAQKCLLKALEHDSENMEAHYNLGLLWESQGVESKALEHYQKFVSKAQGPYTELANELKKRWPALK